MVEDVRLEAAAARCVDLEPPFDPPLLDDEERDADFVPPRADERDELFAAPEREDDFALVLEPLAFFAVDFFAVDFLAEDLAAPDFEDFALDFAEDFEPPFELLLEELFEDLAALFFAPPLFVPLFALLFAPLFAALLEPPFALLLDELPVDFAALFLAPDFAADFVPFLLLEPLFFAVEDAEPLVPLVLVSLIELDLSSVGIAASFKDLHVQPSRLHKATSLYQASSGFRKV